MNSNHLQKSPIAVLLFLMIFFALLEPKGAQAGIGIEQMQRQVQARFHYLTFGNYLVWPPCRSGLAAPLYPPDGFYGNLDDDPLFASYLVADLWEQLYGRDQLRYRLYQIDNYLFVYFFDYPTWILL